MGIVLFESSIGNSIFVGFCLPVNLLSEIIECVTGAMTIVSANIPIRLKDPVCESQVNVPCRGDRRRHSGAFDLRSLLASRPVQRKTCSGFPGWREFSEVGR